jgi:hypothetical protein
MQLRPVFAISLALLAVHVKSHAASPESSLKTSPSSVAIVERLLRKVVQVARLRWS